MTFNQKSVRIGVITTIMAIIANFVPAVYVSTAYDVMPSISELMTLEGVLAATFFFSWVVQPISFYPALGTAGTGSAHHVCNDKVCQPGDAIYLDLGGGYKHYWSDITRSFHMGKPSEEYVSVYNHVREAQQRAFEAIKPGVRACDVHMVAWNYLDQHRLSCYFPHRTGHGVGMEGHELPNLSKDNPLILEPGMTFSCEPGVYNGKFGVRIEDTVCVTETGAMSFNHYTKDLIIL